MADRPENPEDASVTIFLMPPQCDWYELRKYMLREGFNRYSEMQPSAGMRKFKVWREDEP